jgi:ABC-type lipoprotein release transport system permease subunit
MDATLFRHVLREGVALAALGAASASPARRAASADPIVALREP